MIWNVLCRKTSRLSRKKRKKLKCYLKIIFKGVNHVIIKQKGFSSHHEKCIFGMNLKSYLEEHVFAVCKHHGGGSNDNGDFRWTKEVCDNWLYMVNQSSSTILGVFLLLKRL